MRAAAAVKHANGDSANVIPPDEVLFGRSALMLAIRRWAEKISNTDVPVLICGDPGTGKELLARWVHQHSAVNSGQFVKVNCAAIPGTLLESELFGYEKGAFTGAHISKAGRVEVADKGTLFLDEIADLDMSLQSKLLQFLQDGSFSRIGGDTERTVNTRIICATNRDLDSEILAGRFRADLYYRISVLQVRLPRLRERKEDVPLLADYFRRMYQKQFGKECEPLAATLLSYLENLNWPGNVRELSNVIARLVLIGQEALLPEQAPQERRTKEPSTADRNGHAPLKAIAKEAIREIERNVILEALQTNQWNRRKAAEALKISYRALIYKIREAGLVSRLKSGASALASHEDDAAPGFDRKRGREE